MSEERFLVTGALGCVGAWTVRELIREGTPVVGFDLGTNTRRLAQILEPGELEQVTLVTGDVTDLPAIERTLDEHGITNVVHLAALQVPFCRADPPLGAAVNVLGTVNVFEAVRRLGLTTPIAYASSMAAYSAADVDPDDRSARGGCRAASREPLRRLQGRERGQCPDLLGRLRRRQRRRPADDGLRRRARPGDDERADGRDRGGRARSAVRDRVRRVDRLPVRGGRREDAAAREPLRAGRLRGSSTSAATRSRSATGWRRSRTWSRMRPA